MWPYPFWIAHRGAGKLAPENTLAAFRLGAAHGWRMAECDVKLSQDGVPFLMHDATLERTTSGHGAAGERPWGQLAQLDAGGWHSRQYAGEPLPTLENVARWCLANGVLLDLEIKPTPGQDEITGQTVAACAAALWADAPVPPLLTSFSVPALQAAQRAAPRLSGCRAIHANARCPRRANAVLVVARRNGRPLHGAPLAGRGPDGPRRRASHPRGLRPRRPPAG